MTFWISSLRFMTLPIPRPIHNEQGTTLQPATASLQKKSPNLLRLCYLMPELSVPLSPKALELMRLGVVLLTCAYTVYFTIASAHVLITPRRFFAYISNNTVNTVSTNAIKLGWEPKGPSWADAAVTKMIPAFKGE